MFGHLKSEADRLALDAAWLQRERNAHARRGYALFRRRIGSPLGLAACFGAGVFAGARVRRPAPGNSGDHRSPGHRGEPERSESGLAGRILHGPVGAAALRLATAYVAGALMKPAPPDGTGHDLFP